MVRRRVDGPGSTREAWGMNVPLPFENTMPKADTTGGSFGLERRFDAAFTARLALREKQVQQSYRPIISIHKWFARRPGSLFRSLLLAEFGSRSLSQDYWATHDLSRVIADPFMGGGTTVFEALRLGISVVGSDINPMAYWLVRQAVEHIDLAAFTAAGKRVWQALQKDVGELYETKCLSCGEAAEVKYFLWVKTCICPNCGEDVELFPGYRMAEAVRHPREVYHCPRCDRLHEIEPTSEPECPGCGLSLRSGNVHRGKATCNACSHQFAFAGVLDAPPRHQLFGIEYQCRRCYRDLPGRQFKTPDADDHGRVALADSRLALIADELLIPSDEVPAGDETTRLLRWGYRRYRDLFNNRQLLGLGYLLREIQTIPEARLRHALATVFSDFLRYQNLLCRYDTYALKCQDIFSVHGYPVGLIACENNLPGIPRVGSGSFVHFLEKYAKAKAYAKEPYETRYARQRKTFVPMPGETVEARLVEREPQGSPRSAWLACGPSQDLDLAPASLDAVFTDPPYFDNVQYAELMDFCFVWLRTFLRDEVIAFAPTSTRTHLELTGNDTLKRGLAEFTVGLSQVFCRMATALKPGAPLVFTYHHNDPLAYVPLTVGLLDAGLTCTAVLPAPGEMAASLHIAGTKSSILDSVFVCRARDFVSQHADQLPIQEESVDRLVEWDAAAMAEADYQCTRGDLLCLRAGQIAAAVVRQLGSSWDATAPLAERTERVKARMLVLEARVQRPETSSS
jgi:16S rRNA G966 N2-methylase RsmD